MNDSPSFAAYLESPYRSLKHSSYFRVYDTLFGPYRGRAITFVEVGILGGGSLFMWRSFFGPQARIIGVDLNPNARKWEKDGFEIFIGSQSDTAFWQDFARKVGPVDILLDDGGHTYAQQIITVESMLDAIRDKGLLVVEDTHTSYLQGYGPEQFSFMRYSQNLIDRINRRSSLVSDSPAERRIWSVQCFESIVAFHINRPESAAPSVVTTNDKPGDDAQDFRHRERRDPRIVTVARPLVPLLRHLPGIRRASRWLRNRAELRRFRIDRFFR